MPMRLLLAALLVSGMIAPQTHAQIIETASGAVQGITESDGLRVFRGIPYAAPPVEDLRWQPPQAPEAWEGVRLAHRFSAQCMQRPIYSDMMFRSEGTSEDCLYLNVWTPAAEADASLPVLVYFFGGGFIAGDGSERRYDGASLARDGIVVVTVNYRLGVFGFLAHPELSGESPHGASGNYGLLDQTAALRWVHDNIAGFGGDPMRVTIAGESAGSVSVNAQMVSPLSRDLIAGAIGESGSMFGTLPPVPLAEAEAVGREFGESIGEPSLAALRALPATTLLTLASQPGMTRFPLSVDGYLFPRPPLEIYAAGEAAAVPLLVGWNSLEMSHQALFGQSAPTRDNFEEVVRRLYGERADEVLERYGGDDEEAIIQAATDLAGDRFIGYSTWKWYELHRTAYEAPVYRYYYAHPRPPMREAWWRPPSSADGRRSGDVAPARGASHSAEIEYALGNLDVNPIYAWREADYAVSDVLRGFFSNFIKTGNPNGPDLPSWPAASRGDDAQMMWVDVKSRAIPAANESRYRLLDRIASE